MSKRVIPPDQLDRMAAARDTYMRDMKECVALGLVVGMPCRLGRGETRISRARKEIAHMDEFDDGLETLRQAGDPEALATETNAEAWNRLHGDSLNVFGKILGPDIPFDIEHLPLIHEQNLAAQKVITISAKLAIERFRGQNVGALGRLIDRMRAELIGDREPELIGYEDG